MTIVNLYHNDGLYHVSFETQTYLRGNNQVKIYRGRLMGFESKVSDLGITSPLEAKSQNEIAEGLHKVIDKHGLKGKPTPRRE